MADRLLSEREAFRAARYFLEQFNEREKSDRFSMLIGWMHEGDWGDPLETSGRLRPGGSVSSPEHLNRRSGALAAGEAAGSHPFHSVGLVLAYAELDHPSEQVSG
jgi:hypothetical protein